MFALSLFILSISAAMLGLQIVLIRALSIAQWHHFAYLVISTALLGFGVSGTIIAIAQKFFLRHQKSSMWVFAAAMAFLTPVTFLLAQMLPFDQLQLVWDARQLIYLAAFYLLFFLPFFCAGACICIAFTTAAEKAHHLYFFNMVGSGLGVAVFVALMYTGCLYPRLQDVRQLYNSYHRLRVSDFCTLCAARGDSAKNQHIRK
jgi:hypothetical protein